MVKPSVLKYLRDVSYRTYLVWAVAVRSPSPAMALEKVGILHESLTFHKVQNSPEGSIIPSRRHIRPFSHLRN
jgi:hypothetical protein